METKLAMVELHYHKITARGHDRGRSFTYQVIPESQQAREISYGSRGEAYSVVRGPLQRLIDELNESLNGKGESDE